MTLRLDSGHSGLLSIDRKIFFRRFNSFCSSSLLLMVPPAPQLEAYEIVLLFHME